MFYKVYIQFGLLLRTGDATLYHNTITILRKTNDLERAFQALSQSQFLGQRFLADKGTNLGEQTVIRYYAYPKMIPDKWTLLDF